jgi:hypothetical protein
MASKKTRTLKSIKAGEKFQVMGHSAAHTATKDAALCGAGYVRVETSSKPTEVGQTSYVVNMHGSCEVQVFS